MPTRRKLDPVARLLEAFEAENIRFMLIGMSAANVQGVMEVTLDIDLWVDLPARQYLRVQNAACKTGAIMGANTVAYLEDGIPVNFIFEVTGLGSFASELKHSRRLEYHGKRIAVLNLERILKSKKAIQRDKDLAHIIHIQNLLRCRRGLKRNMKAGHNRKMR